MRTQIFFIPPSSHSIKRKKNPPFAIFSLLFIVPPSPPPPIYMNPHTLRLFSCFSQFTIQIVSDDCPKSRGNQLFCGTPPMEDFSFSLRRLPFLFLKAEEIFSSLCVCLSFLLNVEPNGAIGTRPSIVITAEESIAAAFPESVSSSLLFVAFLLVFLFVHNECVPFRMAAAFFFSIISMRCGVSCVRCSGLLSCAQRTKDVVNNQGRRTSKFFFLFFLFVCCSFFFSRGVFSNVRGWHESRCFSNDWYTIRSMRLDCLFI